MNFKKLLIDIMTPAVEFDCVEMRKAIQVFNLTFNKS